MNKEQFTFHEYVIMGTKESKIVPGHQHKVEIGVGCPRCKTVNRPLVHDQKQKCIKCGLNMHRLGNMLEVWI